MRNLVFLCLYFILCGCLTTETVIYENSNSELRLPDRFVLVAKNTYKFPAARRDKGLKDAYLVVRADDGRFQVFANEIQSKKPYLATVGGAIGFGNIIQIQSLSNEGKISKYASYLFFDLTDPDSASTGRPAINAKNEETRGELLKLGLKFKASFGLFGSDYHLDASSHDEIVNAFVKLDETDRVAYGDWHVFDLSQSSDLDSLLKTGLPSYFLELAVSKNNVRGGGNLDVNHCIVTRYEERSYSVVVSNGCEFDIEVQHCERTKAQAAGQAFRAITGQESAPVFDECRSYKLPPGARNSFTFVYDVTDQRIPALYRLNSPLSYELSAKRRGL